MGHHHFCDFAGHDWECPGFQVRLLAECPAPTPCICLTHDVSMEDGDHSKCPVELLACPEHRAEQLRQMSKFGGGDLLTGQRGAENSGFKDDDGNDTLGFCLWCGENFYSYDEVEAHNADDSRVCAPLGIS